MNNNITVTANNDWLKKPVSTIYSNPPVVNLPKSNIDINSFNQQMVQGNKNPAIVPANGGATNPPGSTPPAQNASLSKKVSDFYNGNADIDAAYSTVTKMASDKANTVVDEAAIRAKALQDMQAEIDATNAVYADKLSTARLAGSNRLGQGTAIQARRGLLGSDFGAAQTDTITAANDEIYAGIEQEKLAKVSALMTKARESANTEITNKNAAREAGAEAHIKYLVEQNTRKEAGANEAIKALVAAQIDPEKDFDKEGENSLAALAKYYGVAPGKIVAGYKSLKATKDAEAAKLKAEQLKDGRVAVGEGQRVFQMDPVTGEYKQVAFNPKTYKPETSSGGDYIAYNNTAGNGTDAPTITDPSILAEAKGRLSKKITGVLPKGARGQQISLAMQQISHQEGMAAADDILATVNRLLANPGGVKKAVGPVQSRLPTFSSDTTNADADLSTLRGQQIAGAMERFKDLRPFSNVDLSTVANASSLLNPIQSDERIQENLLLMKQKLEEGIANNKSTNYMGTAAKEEFDANQQEQGQPETMQLNGKTYEVGADGLYYEVK